MTLQTEGNSSAVDLTQLAVKNEETDQQAEVPGLLDVSKVILPERPYHGITYRFLAV